jgi:hypothetical protein
MHYARLWRLGTTTLPSRKDDADWASAERSPLRLELDDAIAEAADDGIKLMLKDLTVLSELADPFRVDTPANHRIGKWLATTAQTQGWGRVRSTIGVCTT